MATYYVDPTNGNDADDGLSWANAFLTLNGAEDEPVAANDTVYVGPGVYRELLTCDIDGSAGNLITYIADVSGENTDSVGGIVRVTGSDNDQSNDRAAVIDVNGKDYRTFRGFYLNGTTAQLVISNAATNNLVIEDCFFSCGYGKISIRMFGAYEADDITIRRCAFLGSSGVHFDLTAAYAGANNLIENCLFVLSAYNASAVLIDRCDGWTVKNCTFMSYSGCQADGLNANGYTLYVYDCIFFAGRFALMADAVGGLVENYNTLYGYATDRTSVAIGANSVTYPPLFQPPILADGYKFPWWFSELSEWSQVRTIAGTSMSAEDLRGITRPVTDSKKSWGAVQFADTERETTTTYDSSDASIVFNDAGRHQMWVPVTAVSTTISVRVYREANYAGNLPQMIIKQPGQADDVTTDVAAASQWNELTTTLTPAALPPYVIVELVSRNTNTANPTTNDVFFDSLAVT